MSGRPYQVKLTFYFDVMASGPAQACTNAVYQLDRPGKFRHLPEVTVTDRAGEIVLYQPAKKKL